SGPNTYTGTTTVASGPLYVDSSQAGSPVLINPGALLGGSGTVGSIASNQGTLLAGNPDPATLTAAGDLDPGLGSSFQVALNGIAPGAGYGQVVVGGLVHLNGAALSATAGFLPSGNNQFTIIDNLGSNPVGGTFANLAGGSVLTISGEPYRINYDG